MEATCRSRLVAAANGVFYLLRFRLSRLSHSYPTLFQVNKVKGVTKFKIRCSKVRLQTGKRQMLRRLE